jgi:hypothetical protein
MEWPAHQFGGSTFRTSGRVCAAPADAVPNKKAARMDQRMQRLRARDNIELRLSIGIDLDPRN